MDDYVKSNERCVAEDKEFTPTGYYWMFGVLPATYREEKGEPITRMLDRLRNLDYSD